MKRDLYFFQLDCLPASTPYGQEHRYIAVEYYYQGDKKYTAA